MDETLIETCRDYGWDVGGFVTMEATLAPYDAIDLSFVLSGGEDYDEEEYRATVMPPRFVEIYGPVESGLACELRDDETLEFGAAIVGVPAFKRFLSSYAQRVAFLLTDR